MWRTMTEISGEDIGDSYVIEYDKDRGMYRVSIFKGYHWQDEIIFDEVDKNE